MSNRKHAWWAVVGLLALAACGGGGGGGGSEPPPTPDPLEAVALGAGLRGLADGEAGAVGLRWIDVFDDESGYSVERDAGAGWVAIAQLPGRAGRGSPMEWRGAGAAGDRLRVRGTVAGKAYPLASASQAASLSWEPVPSGWRLALAATEPLQAEVAVRLEGVPSGTAARFRAGAQAAFGPAVPVGQDWAFDTTAVADGAIELQAQVERGDMLFVLRRSVLVDNPPLLLTLRSEPTATGLDLLAQVRLLAVRQHSPPQLWIDGRPSGLSPVLGPCPEGSCSTRFDYAFRLQRSLVGEGPHRFEVRVSDEALQPYAATLDALMNDAPQVSLEAPLPSAFVTQGRLRLRGSARDASHAIRQVVAALNGVPIWQGNAADFDVEVDVAGQRSGSYELTLTATDSLGGEGVLRRGVVLQQGFGFAVERLAALDEGALLLADAERVLLTGAGTARWLQAGVPGSRDLPLAAEMPWQWFGSAAGHGGIGRVAAGGPSQALYWDAQQRLVNVSAQAGQSEAVDSMAVSGPWVAWTTSAGAFLRHVVDGRQYHWAMPAGVHAMRVEPLSFDDRGSLPSLVVVQLREARQEAFWWPAGGTARSIATGPALVQFQRDADQLVWSEVDGSDRYVLRRTPLGSFSPVQTVASETRQAWLGQGLLAWSQRASPTTEALFVQHAGGTVTLSSDGGGLLVSEAQVVFSDAQRWFVWDAVRGRRPLLDVAPGRMLLSRGWLYLELGPERVAYRVRL